jgi:hypothetical protein
VADDALTRLGAELLAGIHRRVVASLGADRGTAQWCVYQLHATGTSFVSQIEPSPDIAEHRYGPASFAACTAWLNLNPSEYEP